MAASDVHTSQDDIPPVHVLEAAQNLDRKETEDLLAGFDRPGHRPKAPSRERDFVDYYAKKKTPAVDSGSGRAASAAPLAPTAPRGPRQVDVSTVVVPRKQKGIPAWLGWSFAAIVMMLIGVVVARLATSGPSSSQTSTAPTGPSAATTITAATPVPQSAFENIPPPDPPTTVTPAPTPTTKATTSTTTTTTVVVEPAPPVPTATTSSDVPEPRGSARREPRNARGAASGASAGSAPQDVKPPPRDDFIRGM